MKKTRLLFALLFLLVFTVCPLSEIKISARGSVATPTFKIKRINGGTGVKIIINKTKKASYYVIEMTYFENTLSKYWSTNTREINYSYILEENGRKKRTFVIDGLPKGTYTFIVSACNNFYSAPDNVAESEEKTVKIKAAKDIESPEKSYDFSETKAGDVIKFGSYEQDDNMINGKEDLEWIVLSREENKLFVISKYVLNYLPFNIKTIYENNKTVPVTWENSSIRKFLNDDFYMSAFNDKEKEMVATTKLKNNEPPETEAEGGNDTDDKVFLLSYEDITNTSYGFSSDPNENDITRRCSLTAYAKMTGFHRQFSDNAYFFKSIRTAFDEIPVTWLLRSPGNNNSICEVLVDGSVKTAYVGSYTVIEGIRPALWINLENLE